jgi:3-oxoacyl-[acyl-carrier protein] reductase
MNFDLNNKVVLVTGSSSGLGLGIAQYLIAKGAKVILNGRNAMPLRKACKEIGALDCFVADVTRPEEANSLVKRVVENHLRIDGVICNVGSGSSVPPGEESFGEWERVFAINLFSATNIVEASKEFISKQNGSIVCISSICGLEVIPNAPLTYSAAKAALNAYVKGISRPLGKMGVRINAVAPGNLLFEGSVWQKKIIDNEIAVDELLQESVTLRKLGKPEDVASMCAFLLTPSSDFITGSVITVDGGQVH